MFKTKPLGEMHTINHTHHLLKNNKGIAAIVVALMLLVLIGVAALAIDIGYRNVAQNEIQNIVDGAALAGAAELGRQYMDESFVAVDETAIVAIAESVANSNEPGFSITVEIGVWKNHEEGFYVPDTPERVNAVRAVAQRGGNNSQIPTFFARIWNILGIDAQADAVAALTGANEIAPGELEIPVGISENWFTGNFCDQNIQFYPTSGTEGCAGWHTYFDWPANAQKLIEKLDGLTTGSFESPGFSLDENPPPSFVFTGGNLSSATDSIYNLYQAKCIDDGTGVCVWSTKVVVYDAPCGENPNQTIPVIGFATVEITGVGGPPPVMTAKVACGLVTDGVGGGSYYGTWGSIPGLVE